MCEFFQLLPSQSSDWWLVAATRRAMRAQDHLFLINCTMPPAILWYRTAFILAVVVFNLAFFFRFYVRLRVQRDLAKVTPRVDFLSTPVDVFSKNSSHAKDASPMDLLSIIRIKNSNRQKIFLERFSDANTQKLSPEEFRGRLQARNSGVGTPYVYAPSGGVLPTDDHRLYPNRATWSEIDNGTCLDYTDEPLFDWQRRAPYAILLGAMKGGTHALSEYLWDHPLVARPHGENYELHFFDGRHFQRDSRGIPQKQNQISYAQRFRAMYPEFFSSRREGKELVTIHDSPRYLLWSDRIPDAILCVTPWVKLMAVLRDPVERAISHYRFQDEARRKRGEPMVDWDKWVNDDLQLLKSAGVVKDWSKVDFDSFSGSEQEFLAWKTYLRSANSQMILGRALYAIQIEHYFEAMDRVGKPRSDFLVIRSEDLRNDTQNAYDQVLRFLDLPSHTLRDSSAKHETAKNASPLPDPLRERLNIFFEPYNKRLYKLLGWDHVWKY